VSFLESYDLTKDDWDNVMEMCKLPGKPDIMSQIPPKVSGVLEIKNYIPCSRAGQYYNFLFTIYCFLICHDITKYHDIHNSFEVSNWYRIK